MDILPRRAAVTVLAVVLSAGCVSLEPEDAPDAGPAQARHGLFQRLDPGAKTEPSLHFEVHAYGRGTAREVSELAERLYTRIVNDTGLYSFRPESLYPIVIYGSREEFARKTGLPAGLVTGVADRDGAVYSCQGAPLADVIAHELTHLVYGDYMGRLEPVWVNEGLAVYEEQEASSRPASYFSGGRPIPFQEMVLLDAGQLTNLSAEKGYRLAGVASRDRAVGAWYHQVSSVVRFMIEKGGRQDFSEFLRNLKNGRSADAAVRAAFRGRWDGLAGLESAWRGRR